ncbi:MAG: molybdopterin biosynthesis protein [Christensenellales bacterium]|nr:molybdopterin biosynthesis protein [Christensenellales bacterium]
MGFEYLTNVPLEQARREYLQMLSERGFGARTERIGVQSACGRITAEAVYASICAPHFAASAMDGVAVNARDTFGATETTPKILRTEQFVVLDTGDPIPQGCDAVIMVEDIVKNDDGSITIYDAVAPWQHIRQIGEDICAGEMILPCNTEVTPAAIGALIAGGVLEINVIAKPVIGIIPTGDEIVPPCNNPAPGEILEFNSAIFSSMVRQWGAEAVTYPIVPDCFDQIRDRVAQASRECDMVLLNAGSSAGREDYSSGVIRALGEVLYHGIAIKPGKPAILGCVGAKPVLGVPGYPVSGMIVIEELLRPLVEQWLKVARQPRKSVQAILTRPVVSGLKYQEFVRVRMGSVGGKRMAAPLSRGSGVVSSFMKADGILEVPQGVEGYEAGAEVTIRLLCREEKLDNTLVVNGSHDPLLDELADMMHAQDGSIYMSSSHVGSMGGIMAVRRGEAHAAGCHLLDTETGQYNIAFMKKYFPAGGVKLIRCVGRQQGLMVQKGNPLSLGGFADLTKKGLRYVNRQKGSGTRILSDYLCRENGINPTEIYGYDREEPTHTSVAAQIANGSADAGMGIYSAARLYDLDFLPVCIEEYDLIVPDCAWDTPVVQRMLATMKSEAFREKLLSLGGYILDRPGEVIEYLP